MKKIYALIWKHWLWNDFYKSYDKVIKVKGWRTALIETKSGQRLTTSPCFKIFGLKFY